MGSTWERQKLVIKLESTKSEADYVSFSEVGSNNVVPTDWGWVYHSFGWPYNIIGEACKWAADCEGGMLKPNKMETSPEAYIRQWRKALKEAIPAVEFFKTGSLSVEIARPKSYDSAVFKHDFNKRRYIALLPKFEVKEKKFFDADIVTYRLDCQTDQDLRDFVTLRSIIEEEMKIYYMHVNIYSPYTQVRQ
jgi:hypothetical protein